MSTASAEPGNRIHTVCSCGNEFSVSPSKHGEHVYCLECNQATLAIHPDEQARLEERRSPNLEKHVRAIALWLGVLGLFFGMTGMTTIVEKSSSWMVPAFGLGATPEGLLFILLGAGILYLSLCLRRHVSWTWSVTLVFASVLLGLVLVGWFLDFLPVHTITAGLLAGSLLTILVLSSTDVRFLFTKGYRRVLQIFPQSTFDCFTSYVFWIPLVVMTAVSLV